MILFFLERHRKKYSNQNANIANLVENLCDMVKLIVVCWSLFTFLIFSLVCEEERFLSAVFLMYFLE